MIEIRPFRQQDFGVLLDLAHQAAPFAPAENADWLEYRKAFDESKRLRCHYIATDANKAVGYGCLEQQGDAPQSLRIYVVCSPSNLCNVGNLLYARLIQQTKELKATRLWARELQDDVPICEFFTGKGFVETRRFTLPDQAPMVVFQLDL